MEGGQRQGILLLSEPSLEALIGHSGHGTLQYKRQPESDHQSPEEAGHASPIHTRLVSVSSFKSGITIRPSSPPYGHHHMAITIRPSPYCYHHMATITIRPSPYGHRAEPWAPSKPHFRALHLERPWTECRPQRIHQGKG